jgi:hypothetical protein
MMKKKQQDINKMLERQLAEKREMKEKEQK